MAKGEDLSSDDLATLEELHMALMSMKENLNRISMNMRNGYSILSASNEMNGDLNTFSIDFSQIKSNDVEYPTMIYDGPFSDSVVNKKIEYNDLFNVKTKASADLSGDTDIIVRTLKQPNCVKVNIEDDGTISFDIEKELGVEIVGETKVKISVEEDEEPWEEVEDEMTEEVEEQIENEVDEKYI